MLLEIETDKAQMDVEAQDDGILAKIIVREVTATFETKLIAGSKVTVQRPCKSAPG